MVTAVSIVLDREDYNFMLRDIHLGIWDCQLFVSHGSWDVGQLKRSFGFGELKGWRRPRVQYA